MRKAAFRPPQIRGVAVGLYPGMVDSPTMARRLVEVRALSADTVALVVTWSARDVHASTIAPGDDTVSDAAVLRAIRMARALRLNVLVFPILTLEKVGPGDWRGTVRPRDRQTWWLAYERFILHYAAIAAKGGAESLLIGSELSSTESWRGHWFHLISQVESVFSGDLYYSANWDHYQHVSFWQRLDAIGITGYFELSKDPAASQAELTRAWLRIREKLTAFARAQQKPLLITELGYPSQDGAAGQPWNYTRDAAVDVEEQRRALSAFAQVFGGDALFGVILWAWDGPGGLDDGSYTPRGKPAARSVRDYFEGKRGPGSPKGGARCEAANATPRSVTLDHTT